MEDAGFGLGLAGWFWNLGVFFVFTSCWIYVVNVGCLIINTPPIFFLRGGGQLSYKIYLWESIAGIYNLIEPHLPPLWALWAQKSECWGLGICLDALWNMTLLAILKVNRANWLLVLEKKLELEKKFLLIAMLGPLLAMPSGQGLNMTLLAILKVNRANWLLVLEIKLELRKKVSTIDKISLLVRQHYCFSTGEGVATSDSLWHVGRSCVAT